MTGGRTSKGDENSASSSFQDVDSPVWVFGYGSLLWKTNFPYADEVVGHVKGYARRFWQGSTNHRGVPGAPGRVATLVQTKEECTWGIAYKVQPKDVPEVMAYLNHRERGGYMTFEVTIHPKNEEIACFTALAYIGTEANPHYLGPAPTEAIARQVVSSKGQSGCNIEYVLELAKAMRKIAPLVCDEHIFSLEAKVLELMKLISKAEMPQCKCCHCGSVERTT